MKAGRHLQGPHLPGARPAPFLEGVLIAAVVGTEAIYIYLRDEYHGCRALLQRRLTTCVTTRCRTSNCGAVQAPSAAKSPR